MKQVEQDIKAVLHLGLDETIPNKTFSNVWALHTNKRGPRSRHKKAAFMPLVAVLVLLTLCTIGFASYGIPRLIDNTDLPFVDDPEVIGRWQAVGFVSEKEDFNPKNSIPSSELYLNSLAFAKNGKLLNEVENTGLSHINSTWTKGVVLSKQLKTASEYEILQINNENYMFLEWKSGDYIARFKKPSYYVLKQMDTKDYSAYEAPRIKDKIDYPFVNNADMLGKWESVGFVKDIEQFDPQKPASGIDLFLRQINILGDGKLTILYGNNEMKSSGLNWTENLIIDKDQETASKCEFRTIDNQVYMFFEWKSGDYVAKGVKPQYYVLNKVQ